jgi:hypothetical protein
MCHAIVQRDVIEIESFTMNVTSELNIPTITSFSPRHGLLLPRSWEIVLQPLIPPHSSQSLAELQTLPGRPTKSKLVSTVMLMQARVVI